MSNFLTVCAEQKGFNFNLKILTLKTAAFTSIRMLKKKRKTVLAVGGMIFQKRLTMSAKSGLFLAIVSDSIPGF